MLKINKNKILNSQFQKRNKFGAFCIDNICLHFHKFFLCTNQSKVCFSYCLHNFLVNRFCIVNQKQAFTDYNNSDIHIQTFLGFH